MTEAMPTMKNNMGEPEVSFSHIQLYVDRLESVEVYKELERSLNKFSKALEFEKKADGVKKDIDTAEKFKLWQVYHQNEEEETKGRTFIPQNRDVVKQLIVGFGFRVTGFHYSTSHIKSDTRSVLITSKDQTGVQIVVTAVDSEGVPSDKYHHFSAANLERFFGAHSGRQGIAVLGFYVNDIELVYKRYQKYHPKLIHTFQEYDDEDVKVLEVFAYYTALTPGIEDKNADAGTILRFIETNTPTDTCPLPGLQNVDAVFDPNSQPAYCDHWVSNVFSRTEFLSTLQDTLGFTPKVDFNAGVVAAGEAQIESTVTGNNSNFTTNDKNAAIRDQSQVYLPINNALSEVGHVHGFLHELGQGVQHVASRVENIVSFVQQCNEMREITGEGFTFLNIPRSYYGVLSTKYLVNEADIPIMFAEEIMSICEKNGVISEDGAVDLNKEAEEIASILKSNVSASNQKLLGDRSQAILQTVMRSRYSNLYSLLRNHVAENTYMGIVKNKILVDVQGEDRRPGEEAPFFEFIQRVCSECEDDAGCPVKIKPGCGGFGIRNFLTLFLSIEVSKAMLEASEAKRCGDEKRRSYSQKRVDCFTSQLNEANPILTEISDSMTLEGVCKGRYEAAKASGDDGAAMYWKEKMEGAGQSKEEWNKKLMECSARYEQLMRAIREAAE